MKIIHDVEACIGCGACAAICPEHWDMDSNGKAELKNSKPGEEGKTELELDDGNCNQEAADSCPVTCIYIVE